MRIHKAIVPAAVAGVIWVAGAYAHSTGPDPRFTAAPGDAPDACSACHGGSPNTGKGSVVINFPGSMYTPGSVHHITVQVSDPNQRRWGFQLSARLNSDLAHGQAGDLNPSDNFTQVICDNGFPKPCPAGQGIEFIEHTLTGTRNGTSGGATFEFDWTAPASGSGPVTLFAAGNAANGDGDSTGDLIYTTNVQVAEGSGATTGGGTGGGTGGAGGGSTGGDTGGTPQVQVQVTRYALHNLVSDQAGVADKTDVNLTNPWGIALSPTSPFWVSNNHSGTATLYNGTGDPFPVASPRVVRIPPAANGSASGSPTGQVFNATPGFEVASGKPAAFIFATEDGTIAGWNSDVDASNAKLMVDNSGAGAVYKGLALGVVDGTPVLWAANFSAGTVDAFDASFKPLATAGFKDPDIPAGFAPFNIQRFGRRLYVTYALQDNAKHDDVAGAGNGYISVFDLKGNLRGRLASGGVLDSPWGLAIAPGFFGDYSNTLLVGNFGDGTINAFDPLSGESLGPLTGADGNPIVVEGLWGLIFGNGKNGGDANTLYFSAGVSGGGSREDHGLFGSIQPQ